MLEYTLFGGAIHRRLDGSWWWCDGNLEPRARDARPWAFHQSTRGGATYVEVLQRMADTHGALEWVRDGASRGRFTKAESSNHTIPIRRFHRGCYCAFARSLENPLQTLEHECDFGLLPDVILVPLSEWERWTKTVVLGVEWDFEHQDAILARARGLGWRG